MAAVTINCRESQNLLALLGRAHDEDVSHSAVAVPGSGMYSLSESLSERELEVLWLIVAGYSKREIADRLVIAVRTNRSRTRPETLVLPDVSPASATGKSLGRRDGGEIKGEV